MTFNEFRRYGHISRLSEVLVSKAADDAINTAKGITGNQLAVSSQAGQQSASDYASFKSSLSPLITQQTALASGDRGAALSAAMPVISKLASGFGGSKQAILNSMPAGAARDRALADLSTQMFTTIGSAQADAARTAPQTLASLAPLFGSQSLQELGAQLSGLQSGSSTNFGAGQLGVAQEQAMLQFFSGLAQAGGSAAAAYAKGGCWIAEAIYGTNDLRTHAVRAYMNGRFSRTTRGARVMEVYRLIGRPIAWFTRRCGVLRWALKPLFDVALGRALRLV